ncbi:hypothetical protein FHY15_000196 [Xanthomonas arboricola]|nr:hypothetical protein [Xanthomonas arboricola]
MGVAETLLMLQHCCFPVQWSAKALESAPHASLR